MQLMKTHGRLAPICLATLGPHTKRSMKSAAVKAAPRRWCGRATEATEGLHSAEKPKHLNWLVVLAILKNMKVIGKDYPDIMFETTKQ